MKRAEYFLDFEKLEEIVGDEYILWFDERDRANFKYEFLKQTYFNKPAKKFNCPVMLYLGNKKFNDKYELDDILQQIKSEATRIETEYYRSHFKENDTNINKIQFLKHFKSFTPCGIFYNRKSRVDIRQLNGIIMLHNFYNELNSEQLDKIKNDKFTFAVFKLLDQNRYAVLVKTNGMTSKNYQKYQLSIKAYYNKLITSYDLLEAFINQNIYLGHDSKLFMNMESLYYVV